MQTKSKHIPILPAFLALIAALMMGSCINESGLCPTDSQDNGDEEGFTIRFTMATRNAKGGNSRALIDPGLSVEVGNSAENYLDLDNLKFLLFDGSETLQRVFVPEVSAEENGAYVKYDAYAFINDRFIKDAVKQAEYSKVETNVTFSILVLANYSGLDPQNFTFHAGQKMEEIFNKANAATFAMPGSNNANGYWIPNIFRSDYTDALGNTIKLSSSAHIPMAGLQTFTVSTADLRNSTPQRPLQLSPEDGNKDINMLRALAKIEVVDKSGTLTDLGRSRITAIELIGKTTRGSIVPAFKEWKRNTYLETQYVIDPSIPAACQYTGYFPTSGTLSVPTESNGLISKFFADKAATDLREDGRPVFSCYLTEFSTSQLVATDKKPMWMRVKVQDYDAAGSPIASKWKYYKIELADYKDGTPGETLNILRNNIYRYEVNSIGYGLNLTLKVLDWTTQTVSWSYDNVPAVNNDGLLRWTVNGGALPNGMLNETTATLTITNSDMLAGTFAFAQPIGGTWQATLVQGNKDTAINAFIFVDESGEEIKPPLPDVNPPANPSVSGYIDGKPAVIRIKAKNPPTDNDQEMRLIFTVTSLDGRMMSADLVGGRYGSNKYFTIQQNAKL